MAHYCSNCGGSVEPGQKYCMNCGAPIIEATRQASYRKTNSGYAAPHPQAQVITNGSPLSRAWNDFRMEKNLIGRLLILAIIGCIPIVNFFVYGYCLMWSADACFGRKRGMPDKVMTMPTFILGFYFFIVSLVWAVVFCVLSAIPLIGILSTVALLVLLPCLMLSQVRLALFDSLGSAFEISKVWDLFRPNMGSTLLIAWAPQIVALAVGVLVGLAASLMGGASILTILFAHDQFALAMGGIGVIVVGIAAALLLSFVEFAVLLVTFRAFGYFVAEDAPQWVRDGLAVNPQARL